MSIINKIANSFLVKSLLAIKNGSAVAHITAFEGDPNGNVLSPNPKVGTLVIDTLSGDVWKYVSGTEYKKIGGKTKKSFINVEASDTIDTVNLTVNQTTIIWNTQVANGSSGLYSSTIKALINGDEVDYVEYGILQLGSFSEFVPTLSVIKSGDSVELRFDGDSGNTISIDREVLE